MVGRRRADALRSRVAHRHPQRAVRPPGVLVPFLPVLPVLAPQAERGSDAGTQRRISRPVRKPIAGILLVVGGDPALRAELKAMADRDTQAGGPTDERHCARLWEILDDYECWPERRLVDEDGESAAWILAQRALFDPELQRRCLETLEVAVVCGDAQPAHYALLLDRVRMADGKDQLYGSQFVRSEDGNSIVPWPIEDVEHVDARRERVGLTLLAEQAREMREQYHRQRRD